MVSLNRFYHRCILLNLLKISKVYIHKVPRNVCFSSLLITSVVSLSTALNDFFIRTARFLNYVWPFFNIMRSRVKKQIIRPLGLIACLWSVDTTFII